MRRACSARLLINGISCRVRARANWLKKTRVCSEQPTNFHSKQPLLHPILVRCSSLGPTVLVLCTHQVVYTASCAQEHVCPHFSSSISRRSSRLHRPSTPTHRLEKTATLAVAHREGEVDDTAKEHQMGRDCGLTVGGDCGECLPSERAAPHPSNPPYPSGPPTLEPPTLRTPHPSNPSPFEPLTLRTPHPSNPPLLEKSMGPVPKPKQFIFKTL